MATFNITSETEMDLAILDIASTGVSSDQTFNIITLENIRGLLQGKYFITATVTKDSDKIYCVLATKGLSGVNSRSSSVNTIDATTKSFIVKGRFIGGTNIITNPEGSQAINSFIMLTKEEYDSIPDDQISSKIGYLIKESTSTQVS